MMGARVERKKRAREQLDKCIVDISEFFQSKVNEFKNRGEKLDLKYVIKEVEKWMDAKMKRNPQEAHNWEKAAMEFQERFIKIADGYKRKEG